jgi:hypothetical protein
MARDPQVLLDQIRDLLPCYAKAKGSEKLALERQIAALSQQYRTCCPDSDIVVALVGAQPADRPPLDLDQPVYAKVARFYGRPVVKPLQG